MPVKKASRTTKATKTAPAKTPAIKRSPLAFLSNIKPRNLILPFIIIAIILILGLLKNQFISATVNGEQITRLELISELEKVDGQRVLQNLVTQKLIEQEAEKRNLTVSEEEIDAEVVKIEESISAQGQNLDDLLAVQNFTREQLREQLENQLLLQKMVDQKAIEVTEEEINQYMEQNQSTLPEGTDVEKVKTDLKEQLKQQKLNGEVQKLLSELQANSKIDIHLK